jgi:hypothetical protein
MIKIGKMKTIKTIFSIVLGVVLCSSAHSKKSRKHKKNKYTPKAYELRNHFGAPTVGSPYGPNTSYEEYVEANPEVFTPQIYGDRNKAIHKALEFHPYPGHEKKINPHFVKAGEMTNIAPSASTIISPEIANPKLHVQAQVNYPAHVKIPNFYGYKKELHPVTAYDTQDGRIIHEKVVLTKPVYGFEDSVRLLIFIIGSKYP